MSTDRELLELAAKANGFQVKGWVGDRLSFFDPILDSAEYEWNPLEDDGDALRLSIRLCMIVHAGNRMAGADTAGLALESVFIRECTVTQSKDAAVRRAIVRAAAEIGRAMP